MRRTVNALADWSPMAWVCLQHRKSGGPGIHGPGGLPVLIAQDSQPLPGLLYGKGELGGFTTGTINSAKPVLCDS